MTTPISPNDPFFDTCSDTVYKAINELVTSMWDGYKSDFTKTVLERRIYALGGSRYNTRWILEALDAYRKQGWKVSTTERCKETTYTFCR